MSLNDTPRGSRLHIGIYGRRNAGKSSLINALTGQDIALVSEAPGTTADPVYKSMEMHPIGPVVFIDTAGFDDEGELGALRVERTESVMNKTDVAVIVVDGSLLADSQGGDLVYEKRWASLLDERGIPVVFAINKCDEVRTGQTPDASVRLIAGENPIVEVSAARRLGLDKLRETISNAVPEDFFRERILGNMIEEGGLVLLVMPQDIQAPKGRLILPQVQTLRELLDRRCTAVSATADGLERTLAVLNRAPDLIVTDSQCFREVYEKKPEQSALTSFSILFAAYKGDLDVFVKGASQLDDMTENSRILIAEACTHVPLTEDIGRVKIPRLLREKLGAGLQIVNVCGNDFPLPEELREFDLIIHCGACMFNRRHVMTRIAAAQKAKVPITNYGVVLAKLTGILDKVCLPF